MDINMVESVFAIVGVGFTVAYLVYLGSRLWDKIGAKGVVIEALEVKHNEMEMRLDALQSEIDLLTDDINTQFDMLRSKKR